MDFDQLTQETQKGLFIQFFLSSKDNKRRADKAEKELSKANKELSKANELIFDSSTCINLMANTLRVAAAQNDFGRVNNFV